jgi:hypothetical protein
MQRRLPSRSSPLHTRSRRCPLRSDPPGLTPVDQRQDYPGHNREHFLIHERSSHVFIQVALKGRRRLDGHHQTGHSQQSLSGAREVIERAVFSARGSCGSSAQGRD